MRRLPTTTTLPSGTRLRVRLPHRADVPRVRALLERLGLAAGELDLARALRFDPTERVALVATVLADRTEEVAGLALMDRSADAPDVLLADERSTPGVTAALHGALRARRVA